MSDEIKVESKNKLNKKVLIAVAAFLGIVLIIILAVFVPKAADAKSVETQLSLGEKYLDELDYEQAIASYLAVIEIDPKNEDAYLALADIYMEMGEYEKAEEILEQAEEEILSKDIWEKQQEVEEAREEALNTLTPAPMATSTPVPTATSTPVPTATSTPIPTVTNTPVPTATNTPVPTTASTPVPTATSTLVPTVTSTPVPTATNTPVPTATPTPVVEGEIRVELELESDCFTYVMKDYEYVCTGLSEKGFAEFQKYNASYLVSLALPSVSDAGKEIVGFYSKSVDGYGLREMLTEESAYVELVCPESYTIYYGVCDERPSSKYADKLVNVVLNEGLEEIGTGALYNCTGLKNVEIPESVIKFGTEAFAGCEKLMIDSFEIGGKKFGGSVFSEVRINKLVMSAPVTNASANGRAVGGGSFRGADIGEVVIAEGVKEIADYTFRDCESLIEITLPETIESIGNYAFENCTGLEVINMSTKLLSVGNGAFSGCISLAEVVIPESVIKFGTEAFAGCEKLMIDSFEIGGKKFGGSVFSEVRINKLVMSAPVTNASANGRAVGGGSFRGADIGEVVIVEGVKEIADYTFRDCESLIEITLPESIEKIGDYAFENCTGLKTLNLSEKVYSIGYDAFSNCKELIIITFSGSYVEQYANENGIPVETE